MQILEVLVSIQPFSGLILLAMALVCYVMLHVYSAQRELEKDRPFVGYSSRMTPYEFEMHKRETTRKELAKLRKTKAWRTYVKDRKNGKYPPIEDEEVSDIEE